MPSRDLPARPSLDHLKREAKALRAAFRQGETAAVERVTTTLGLRGALKLTDAQRVIAREYGFATWAKLRAHVAASRGLQEATDAFLAAIANGDLAGATAALHAQPRIATSSLHVASVLGLETEVRRLLGEEPAAVHVRRGPQSATPLLWLCYSPFHGESPARDEGLVVAARWLLAAGADPNARDGRHGVPALYAVTGLNHAPRVARLLLDAGAVANDGESLFHAAERFHEEALELLLRYGADPNATGDWGNTPLYFLLRHWDVAAMPRVDQGFRWLLDHGADPDVLCGRAERETALHVAVRRGQHPDVVRLLPDHGADVGARRGDGRTAWLLARRAGFDRLAALLEEAGATPEALSPADALLAACGRGDAKAARRLTSRDLVASLGPEGGRLLPDAAARGRRDVVAACLAAGISVDTLDESGATALHHAAIHGRVDIVGELLSHGADLGIRDVEHSGSPLGWACFGADHVSDPGGDYVETVRVLLQAGAPYSADDHEPAHPGARALLATRRE